MSMLSKCQGHMEFKVRKSNMFVPGRVRKNSIGWENE